MRLFAKMKEPKWRYGKRNACLLLLFFIALILLIYVVDTLTDRYALQADMSFNHYASITQQSQKALENIDQQVNLYLLYASQQEDAQLLEVLNRYPHMNENIHVLLTDIAKNPAILNQFSGDVSTQITPDSVIVHSPSTNRFRVLTYNDFFAQGFSVEQEAFVVEGLAYERHITEAIVYVSQEDVPTIGYLYDHGELAEPSADNDPMASLTMFLQANHYDVKRVSLLAGDTLTDIDLLLIAGLQNDVSDGELSALDTFAREGGSFIFLRNYTDPLQHVPNYMSLLRSYGIVPKEGLVVASSEDEGSYFDELVYLLPYMNELDLTLPLIAANADVLMLPGASPFADPPTPNASLSVATVLKSGKHAYIRNTTDGQVNLDQQPSDPVGEHALALYAHKMFATGNISRAFALGNSAIFLDNYLYERTFAEEFIVAVLHSVLPKKTLNLDIVAKTAFRPALTASSQWVGHIVIIALPLLIGMAGFVVLVKRRNQ